MFGWAGLLGAAIGPEHPRLAMAFHVPLAVASIAAVALLWRGEWAADDKTFGSRWFALALATVLADPHLYLQDTIVVAPAAIAWMCTRPAGMRAGAALTLVLGMFILGLGGGPNLHWHANLFVAWMGAVLATLVVRGMRSSRAMARSEHIEDSAIVPARAA
jgi:hypothetical protein